MKICRSFTLKLCLYLVAALSIAAASTPPSLTASPSAVDFQYTSGNEQPLPVFVTVTASDGSSPAITVTVTPGPHTPVTLFPQPPISGDTIQADYSGATLNQLINQPGVYTATYTVTAAGFAPLTIPLTFSVGGTLSVVASPTSLTFIAPSGPTVQTLELSGYGGSAISFSLTSVTSGGGNWLNVATSGSYTPATLTVTVNPTNVPAGTFTGSITVAPSSGATVVIPIALQVGSSILAASPASLAFSYTTGNTTPPPQTLQLTSTLPNDTYVAQATSSGNWLLVNGVTTVVSGTLPASVNVTVNPAGLGTGTYSGTISVTDVNGNAQVVAVTLVVGIVSSIANPTQLVFVAQAGGPAPAAQTVSVTGVVNTSYTTTVKGTWLSISPPSGQTPAQPVVTANPVGLQPGTYSGTVQIAVGPNVQVIQVTLTVSANAVLTTNPGGYITSYDGGDPAPAPLTLDVGVSSGPRQAFTVAPGVPAWLTVGPPGSPSTPVSLSVTLTPQTLPTGTYLADIILIPTAAGGIPVVVPVLLQVLDAPGVVSNHNSLSFSGTAGGAPQSQTIEVTATTATAFAANTSTVSGGGWLSVSPTSGVANPGNTALTVTADAASLAAGSYQGTVTLTTAGGVVTQIAVTFTVASVTGPLTISPATLAFTYSTNGALPAAQTLQIAGSESFTASAGTSTGGTWLAVTPLSGIGNASLSVSVNPAGLAAGTYSGSITITPAGSAAQVVAVTLVVSGPPALAAAPTALVFAYIAANPAPAAQNLSISFSGTAVAFTATAKSSGWLSVTPTAASTPATLSAAVNPTGLGAGSYIGSITLSGDSGTLELVVTVTLTVTAPQPAIDHLADAASYLSGGIAPGEIVVVFGTSLGPTNGVGATIDSQGFIGTMLGNVQVTFNGYPGPILYASAGQINTIVPYELAGATNAAVEVIFGTARSNPVTLPVVASVPSVFSADASGQGPGAILDVNYQLVSASNPASAGSVIQIFATGQGQTSPAGVDGLIEPVSLPLPMPLLTPGVTIGGAAAHILYAGAAPGLVAGALQVDVEIPDGLPSGPAALFVSIGDNNSQPGITVAIQ
jgi:uncharacterized protein (TIGR03437 family)